MVALPGTSAVQKGVAGCDTSLGLKILFIKKKRNPFLSFFFSKKILLYRAVPLRGFHQEKNIHAATLGRRSVAELAEMALADGGDGSREVHVVEVNDEEESANEISPLLVVEAADEPTKMNIFSVSYPKKRPVKV